MQLRGFVRCGLDCDFQFNPERGLSDHGDIQRNMAWLSGGGTHAGALPAIATAVCAPETHGKGNVDYRVRSVAAPGGRSGAGDGLRRRGQWYYRAASSVYTPGFKLRRGFADSPIGLRKNHPKVLTAHLGMPADFTSSEEREGKVLKYLCDRENDN